MDTTGYRYKEANAYLDAHPSLKSALNLAIDESMQKKKNSFTSEIAHGALIELTNIGILVTNASINHYYLPFDSPIANAALLNYAMNLLKKPLPSNPYDAVLFVKDFFKEICKPRENYHWYTMEVERNFRGFVLMEFEEYFISNYHEIKDIYDHEHDQYSGEEYLKLHLEDVLPHYKLTIDQFFEIASNMLTREEQGYKGAELIGTVASISQQNALELLNHSNSQNLPERKFFIFNIIIALSKFDLERAFEESIALLKSQDYEVEGLKCLGWLDYKNGDQVISSFNVLEGHVTGNEDFFELLPRIYRNLAEHEKSPEQLKTKIIAKFWNLVEHPSKKVLSQVVFWLSSIKGFEEEKMKLLFVFLNKGLHINFWDYFRSFSKASYLFEFIKHIYATLGLKAHIQPFEQALHTFEMNNPREFEEGLVEFLSNEYGIIRKAGIDILASIHIRVDNINLLNLNEKKQTIVADMLLSVPYQIEKTFPIALQLRNSTFQSVKTTLLNNCIQLIFAYEELIIEMLNNNLDMNIDDDKEFFLKIEQVWATYKKVIEQKKGLVELNPFINQRKYSELYYRTEHEMQAEQMEQAHKNSQMISLGIAKQIKVLRGSAFKMEGNNSSISKLGKIETKMYIDRRYFVNPDAYEWAFKNYILNTNYTSDEGDNS